MKKFFAIFSFAVVASRQLFLQYAEPIRNLEADSCPVPRRLFPQPDNLAFLTAVEMPLSIHSCATAFLPKAMKSGTVGYFCPSCSLG